MEYTGVATDMSNVLHMNYKGYDVTRGQEFFRSIIIAWDHCDTVYVVGHWLKDGYVAHDHELLLLIDVYFYM